MDSSCSRMAGRKQRALEELYRLTSKISKPKITPVLQGIYRIQGPVDELEPDIEAINGCHPQEAPLIGKNLFKVYLNGNDHLSSEACVAPCLSGTHSPSQTASDVELKPEDGMSDESGQRKAVKRGSFGNTKSHFVKSNTRDDQPQTSEMSNLVSACSSHDSYSENADSRSVRGCGNSSSCLYDGSKLRMAEEQVDDNHGGGFPKSGIVHGVNPVHRLVDDSFSHVSMSNLRPTKIHSAIRLDPSEKTKCSTDTGGSSRTRGIARSSKRPGSLDSVDISKDVQTLSNVLGRETSGKDGSLSNSASESNSSQSNSTSHSHRCTRNGSAEHHEKCLPNGHFNISCAHETKEIKIHPCPDKGDSRRCSGMNNFEEEHISMEKKSGSLLVSKNDKSKTSDGSEKMSLLQTNHPSIKPLEVIDVPRKHGANGDLFDSFPNKGLNVVLVEKVGSKSLTSKEVHIGNASAAQNSASYSRNADLVISTGFMESEKISKLHCKEEPLDSAVEQVKPSLTLPASITGTKSTFKDSSVDNLNSETPSTVVIQRNTSIGAAAKIHPYAEAEHDRDPNATSISHSARNDIAALSQPIQKALPANDQLERCTTSSNASENQGKLQPSQPISDNDHSDPDLVEDDVKVCDICGDAGREEKLAICSRCNDGAEHTYCMQVMLDKVPEGEWLCEECKSKENVENQKHDQSETIIPASRLPFLNEKNKIPKGSSGSKGLPKLDLKVLDLNTKQVTKPVPPRQDDTEATSAAKKQASEKGSGLPNVSSPRKPLFLREGSFKNVDTGKVKPFHSVLSSGGQSANYPEETGTSGCNSRMQSRLQSPQNKFSPRSSLPHKPFQISDGGNSSPSASATLASKASTLSKGSDIGPSLSKLTNSQGIKPKLTVKQGVDEVPQRQLLARNSSFCGRRKEGPVHVLGKSASLKSNTSTVGLVLDDLRSKLPLQNLSRAEDSQSLKQLNEGVNLFGRKNSFTLDHPVNGSSLAVSTGNLSLPKSDAKTLQSDTKIKAPTDAPKKDVEKAIAYGIGSRKRLLSCYSEYMAPLINKSDKKSGQLDEKSKNSKAIAIDTPTGLENIIVSAGSRVQMQALSSLNDSSSAVDCSEHKMMEQNLQQTSTKEDNLVGSLVPDKPYSSPPYTMQEGLLQPRESGNMETRSKELSSFAHTRKFLANGRKIRCFECKEVGHFAQFCPYRGNDSGINVRASATSAMRSSKEVTAKSKWIHAVETALSQKSKNGENDKRSIHSNNLCLPTADLNGELAPKSPLPAGVGVLSDINENADPGSAGASSMEKTSNAQDLLTRFTADDGKKMEPYLREMLFHPFSSCATSSAVPEINYIWQGGFEVHRNGKIADFCDGIQAHLSTCASPKVLEAANRFPSKVQLEEISRLSLWPVQFQAKYPTEDNIALYFFAKDIESYERDYKKLLEYMLRNDLALKANIGGVELLIFTSNQLPDKSRRWNRLYFLWGVFRERRVGCLDLVNNSVEKPSVVDRDMASSCQDISPMVIAETSVVSNLMPPVCSDKDFSSYRTTEAFEVAKASACSSLPSSADVLSSSYECNQSITDNLVPSEKQSSSTVRGINPPVTSDQMACHTSCMAPQGCGQSQIGISLKEAQRDYESRNDMDQSHNKPSRLPNATDSSRSFPAVSEQQEAFSDSSKDAKDICPDQEQEKLKKETQSVSKGKYSEEQDNRKENEHWILADLDKLKPSIVSDKKENCALDLRSDCKRPHADSSEKTFIAVSQTENEISNCSSTNGVHDSKRIKTGNMLKPGDVFSCGIYPLCDLNSTFSENEDIIVHRSVDNEDMAESSKTAERSFFSVDFGHAQDCKASSSNCTNDNDDSLGPGIPNLELALGAGSQSSNKGLLPLFDVLDERSCKDSHSEQSTSGSDGVASSLSLSLAFPVPKKDVSENPVLVSEKVLTEQPHVSTSLLLYGGCMDS